MSAVTDLSELAIEECDEIAAAITGSVQHGKVRSTWPLTKQRRLLVTSDRLSAFDRIIGLVQHKGQVLNELAAWWFDQLADITKNHKIEIVDPQCLIATDTTPLPIEVVVRARLTGSTSTSILPRYLHGERELYGHHLPDGLQAHGSLPQPLITPTTKAQAGSHDEAITSQQILQRRLVEPELWQETQRVALALFERGTQIADKAGFILADTKYEFGQDQNSDLVLIDEVHTPDSSRYWDKTEAEEAIAAGRTPQGYDKEPVRLALRTLGFKGDGPIPELPLEVWQQSSQRYVELYERLTQNKFTPATQPAKERITENLAQYFASNP